MLTMGFVAAILWARKPSAASPALDAKLAQLRAQGVPLTEDELAQALPDPDPEHDAHFVLRDAFAVPAESLYKTEWNDIWKVVLSSTEASPETLMQSMRSFLTTSDTLLEKIPDNLDGVSFSMAWTNGLTDLTLLKFIEMRELMHVLLVKAIYETERGNAAQSAEALRKGFAVTRAINRDVLVHTMIRIACAGLLCDAAERTLNRVRLSDSDLSQLQRSVDAEGVDDFHETFLVERAQGNVGFERARQRLRSLESRPFKLLQWKMNHLFYPEPYRDEDYLAFLNVIDEHRAVSTDDRLSGVERLRRHEQLDAYYDTNASGYLAVIAMIKWSKAMHTASRTKARLTALVTSLAIERYRLENSDSLPVTLEALVPRYLPSVPRDPMDNQPLRYKRRSQGYVLYSVGPDGIDNDGVRRAKAPGIYDLTFAVSR